MKIIGKADGGNYVALVGHTELEKLTYKYYGKLPKLDIGSELDLGEGYNFASDIQQSCKKMQDAYEAFQQASKTLMSFASMVSRLDDPSTTTPGREG